MGSKQLKIKTIVKQKMNKPFSLCLILSIYYLHALKSIYLPINHFSILTFIEEYCKNSVLDVLYCKYGFLCFIVEIYNGLVRLNLGSLNLKPFHLYSTVCEVVK